MIRLANGVVTSWQIGVLRTNCMVSDGYNSKPPLLPFLSTLLLPLLISLLLPHYYSITTTTTTTTTTNSHHYHLYSLAINLFYSSSFPRFISLHPITNNRITWIAPTWCSLYSPDDRSSYRQEKEISWRQVH